METIKPNLLYGLIGLLGLGLIGESVYIYSLKEGDHSVTNHYAEQSQENKVNTSQKLARNLNKADSKDTDDLFDSENWNPYKEIKEMHERMNGLFEKPFERFGNSSFSHLVKDSQPEIKVAEKDDHYEITVKLPKTTKNSIQVKIEDHQLNLSGNLEATQEENSSDGNSYSKKTQMANFFRSIYLEKTVNKDSLKTEMKNGYYLITVKKA